MIICTEHDNDFIKYRGNIKNRKVIFILKQIFKDWWSKFLDSYPNINIRNAVFSNVEKLLKCKTV